jgi:hypothetical protein
MGQARTFIISQVWFKRRYADLRGARRGLWPNDSWNAGRAYMDAPYVVKKAIESVLTPEGYQDRNLQCGLQALFQLKFRGKS